MRFVNWKNKYKDNKEYVDVVWQANSTKLDAILKFNSLVRQENKKYRTIDNQKRWRPIRLYDSNGNVIKQKS